MRRSLREDPPRLPEPSAAQGTTGSTIDFVLEGLAEALSKLAEFQGTTDEEFYAWISHYIRHRMVDAARREGCLKRADPSTSRR